MICADEYRVIAEDCMRQAYEAQDDRSRPLWVVLAQSWLRLADQAEQAKRRHRVAAADDPAREEEMDQPAGGDPAA
jgi:hypothetical protein